MRRRQFLTGGRAAVALGLRGGAARADEGPGVIPRAAWYGEESRRRWGAWGPPARTLPPPPGLTDNASDIARRVTAAAKRYIGLGYQHHHLPDFDPPADWPWHRVSAGTNGPGLDCSNYTSLAFNEGLGIKLPTGIGTQASALTVGGPGGQGSVALQRIAPASFDDAVATLRPADLLYIRSDAGRVSHVVLWLGDVEGVPSFIDCTDRVRRGLDGSTIPAGVRIRPFTPDSWYGRRFSHAHRLAGLGTGAGPAPGFADGGDI